MDKPGGDYLSELPDIVRRAPVSSLSSLMLFAVGYFVRPDDDQSDETAVTMRTKSFGAFIGSVLNPGFER